MLATQAQGLWSAMAIPAIDARRCYSSFFAVLCNFPEVSKRSLLLEYCIYGWRSLVRVTKSKTGIPGLERVMRSQHNFFWVEQHVYLQWDGLRGSLKVNKTWESAIISYPKSDTNNRYFGERSNFFRNAESEGQTRENPVTFLFFFFSATLAGTEGEIRESIKEFEKASLQR